jgi:acetate kinase
VSDTVLVLNCGSSSIKYELIDPDARDRLAGGVIERIGEASSRLEHRHGDEVTAAEEPVPDHVTGLRRMLEHFETLGPRLDEVGLVAVGHRVVMGGRSFDRAVLVDEHVIDTIRHLSPLAPLHNPPGLAGIEVARKLLGQLPHVVVFDTAFFHDLPDAAATYALDRTVAERFEIRRYGAHGTSHRYVSRRAAELLGADLADLRQIVLHLGNGASASAVVGGRAVDTSMGFTPLEGLVMGTRTGDIDPAVVVHLVRHGMTIDEVDDLLNRRSGMKGLAGDNDLRGVHRRIAEGDEAARLALDVYTHRIRRYIGAFAAVMGGLDVLSFTAGVGENDAVVRAAAAEGLEFLGLAIDPARNAERSTEPRRISPDGAAVDVLVVPTDEELEIALETCSLVRGR